MKVNHEFVNLLKIGRRVGQKKIGDIEGLFDNRVTTNHDDFILLQISIIMFVTLWRSLAYS